MRTALATLLALSVVTLAGCTFGVANNEVNVNVAAPIESDEEVENGQADAAGGMLSAASISESTEDWAEGFEGSESSEEGATEVVEDTAEGEDPSDSSSDGSTGYDDYPVDVGDSTAPYTNEPFPIQ